MAQCIRILSDCSPARIARLPAAIGARCSSHAFQITKACSGSAIAIGSRLRKRQARDVGLYAAAQQHCCVGDWQRKAARGLTGRALVEIRWPAKPYLCQSAPPPSPLPPLPPLSPPACSPLWWSPLRRSMLETAPGHPEAPVPIAVLVRLFSDTRSRHQQRPNAPDVRQSNGRRD